MEDIVEALYMAAAMLTFVIALTVSMSSFTNIRSQIDEILFAETKVDLATDDAGNYINYRTSTNNANRIVGADTIISSMYRVKKENYVVYIVFNNNPQQLNFNRGSNLRVPSRI